MVTVVSRHLLAVGAEWDEGPIWPGFGWMYETGGHPRANAGVGVCWPPDEPPPSQEEIDRIRAEGIEAAAAGSVESPDAEPLVLPWREYYLWTGPLRSALAFRHEGVESAVAGLA